MHYKIEKGSEEWNLFMDFWNLHQDYYNPKTDEEWEQEYHGCNAMIDKYHGTKLEMFARDLVLAHAKECERKQG